MTKPLISIIMPAYNAERYIAESIRSVLAQTYQNWELIIVDDGSTDRTAEIAQSFVLADSRVKYIFQQNTKVAAARNRGIGKAAGDLIAFLDSDDLWMPEKLERQEAAMRDGNMDVVFCSGFIFTGDDTTDESTPYPSIKGKFDGAAMFKLLLVEVANRIPVLSVIVRREALLDAGLFDESPALYYGAEDYDLWVRIARRGGVFYGMDERLVRYRVHAKGMSRRRAELVNAMVSVVEKYRHDPNFSRGEMRRMFGGGYRALTVALIEENRVAEAKESMLKLIAYDGLGLKTIIFRVLMRFAPHHFDALNKRRLDARDKLAAG